MNKMDDQMKKMDKIMQMVEVLTNKVEDMTISLKTMSETQLWLEKQVIAIRKTIIRTEPVVVVDTKHTFPINCEEVLKVFIKDLRDDIDYKNTMVRLSLTWNVDIKIQKDNVFRWPDVDRKVEKMQPKWLEIFGPFFSQLVFKK